MKRIYNVNDNYFANIDSEEKAYWLGFLMADGYINQRSGQDRLILDIAKKDEDHLEAFKKAINFEGPIKEFIIKSGKWENFKHSQIAITSQKLVDNLNKLGCTAKKSLSLKFPKLKSDLINHFIRGYFDGDGSVFISQEKHWRNGAIKPVIHYRFIGTKEFLENVNDHINLNGRLAPTKGSKAFELSYKRNKKVVLFYNYLYKDASIFLKRKKDIFDLHIKNEVQRL
jgi:hypothetical protein